MSADLARALVTGNEVPYVWLREQCKVSRADHWEPVWLDRETGEAIDFREVCDADEAIALGERCEAQYLGEIELARREFLEGVGGGKREQYQALLAFERELCKNDLYYLGKYVLGYDKAKFHLHYFMCQSSQVAALQPGSRRLWEFPRDTYKTTFLTIAQAVQLVLRDADTTILFMSNSEPNAAQKMMEARHHFEENERLGELWPEHVPKNSRQRGRDTKWRTPATHRASQIGTYEAAGIGKRKTGSHYDHLFCDDIWDERSVTVAEQVAKVNSAIARMEWLLGEPRRGTIRYVGTRFAHDDPTESMCKDPRMQATIVSGIMQCGRSLLPEILPLLFLYQQAQGKPYEFSCQIMLNPTAESQMFRREWFQYSETAADWRVRRDSGKMAYNAVVLSDFAGDPEKTGSGDYAAILVVLISHMGHILLVDGVRDQIPPKDAIAACYQMADKWDARMIVRQNAPLENAVAGYIEDANRERRARGVCRREWYRYSLAGRSKTNRELGLQPLYADGRMFHDPGCPVLKEVERELEAFPFLQTQDDCHDALSMLTDPKVLLVPAFSGPIEARLEKNPITVGELHEIELRSRQAVVLAAYEAADNGARRDGLTDESELWSLMP